MHDKVPGYSIVGNRWSENQSIKLVNWYLLVSVNRWSIDDHTKTSHWLLLIGTATSNRRHTCYQWRVPDATVYLSDHPPFLGSPGDEIGKAIPTQSSQCKEYTPLHVYSNSPLARHCLSVSPRVCNQWKSLIGKPIINLLINRYQSITTWIFAIDWSSIINIKRLTDVDWYWLISIVINYRFHRLDTHGKVHDHAFIRAKSIVDRNRYQSPVVIDWYWRLITIEVKEKNMDCVYWFNR